MRQALTRTEIVGAIARMPPLYRHIIADSGIDPEAVIERDEALQPDVGAKILGAQPPNWPSGIPVSSVTFQNWSENIRVRSVWKARPQSLDDVVRLANWAASSGHRMRASGRSHNWSPLVMGNEDSAAQTLLVDTSGLAAMTWNPGAEPTVTVQLGATLDQLIDKLQDPYFVGERPAGAAPGYGFRNMTAPGALSIGGILAIGGHGTSVSWPGHPTDLNGCLSNLVVSFTAVVTDPASRSPGTYALKTFQRTDADAAAFLVHLGRAFLVEATLRVVPDEWMRLDNQWPSTKVLFAPQAEGAQPGSFASYVNQCGRVEVIWFPYTDNAWTKTWTVLDQQPPPPLSPPYYIPFVNDVSRVASILIAASLQADPSLTKAFCIGSAVTAEVASSGSHATINGTGDNLLRYVKDSTLRVTAGGFAVHTARADVQYVVSTFIARYQALIDAASAQSPAQYPMNSGVEIRVTGTDQAAGLGVPGAAPPALSATAPIRNGLDTVVWVDALTIANSVYYENPYSDPFYTTLENELLQLWGPHGSESGRAVMRPEWSKGWGFSRTGAWTNPETIDGYLTTFPQYGWARETLARYDAGNVFTDDFLSKLLFK